MLFGNNLNKLNVGFEMGSKRIKGLKIRRRKERENWTEKRNRKSDPRTSHMEEKSVDPRAESACAY
jgi:hypothetical protein